MEWLPTICIQIVTSHIYIVTLASKRFFQGKPCKNAAESVVQQPQHHVPPNLLRKGTSPNNPRYFQMSYANSPVWFFGKCLNKLSSFPNTSEFFCLKASPHQAKQQHQCWPHQPLWLDWPLLAPVEMQEKRKSEYKRISVDLHKTFSQAIFGQELKLNNSGLTHVYPRQWLNVGGYCQVYWHQANQFIRTYFNPCH